MEGRTLRHQIIQRRTRSALLASLSLVVCVIATGCTSASDGPNQSQLVAPDGTELLQGDQIDVEYQDAIDAFPYSLPPKYSYADQLGEDFKPTDGHMEKGSGEAAVAYIWLCSWEEEYLESHQAKESTREDAALEMLAKWKLLPNTEFYYSDPTDIWENHILGPAQLGDPSGVKSSFASCSGFNLSKGE